MPHTPRAAATPPLPRIHDRIPASERVRAASWLTFASALLRCSTDLCRPAPQRHDHVRQRARRGARITSQQHAASHEHEHACPRPLCSAMQLLHISLLSCDALPRCAHCCLCCSLLSSVRRLIGCMTSTLTDRQSALRSYPSSPPSHATPFKPALRTGRVALSRTEPNVPRKGSSTELSSKPLLPLRAEDHGRLALIDLMNDLTFGGVVCSPCRGTCAHSAL